MMMAVATAVLVGAILVHDHRAPANAILAADSDFSTFFCAGRVVLARADPYRVEPLRSCEREVGETPAPLPWYVVPAPFPGYVLALFALFALLPFAAAHVLWTALLLLSALGTAWALKRLTGFPLLALVLFVATPLGLYVVRFGEPTSIVAALLASAGLAAERGSARASATAGTLIGLAMIEPHVALPAFVAAFLFAPRLRRALLLTAGGLAVLSIVAVGWAANVEYLAQALPLQAASELHQRAQFSLTHLLVSLAVPAGAALALGSVSYLLALGAGVWSGRRLERVSGRVACLALVPPAIGLIGGTFSHDVQILTSIGGTVLVAALPVVPFPLAVVPLVCFSVLWVADASSKLLLLGVGISTAAGLTLAVRRLPGSPHRRRLVAAASTAILMALYVALQHLPHPPCCNIAAGAPAPRVGASDDAAAIWAYRNSLPPFSLVDLRMEVQKLPFVLGLVALFACALATPPRRRVSPVSRRRDLVSFDTDVPVLILNLGGFPYNQSSVGIARSLGRVGVPVYLIQQGSFIPAAASRFLAGRFVWNTSGLDEDRFIEGMEAIAAMLGRQAIVVPTCDVASILLAEHASALSPWFRFAEPPDSLPRRVADKKSLSALCGFLGVPSPRAYFPNSRAEVLELAGRLRFPLIAKAAEGWLLPPRIRSTTIVSNRDELVDLFDTMASSSAPTSLIVQELIPDDVAEDWFVHGYCDGSGTPVRIAIGVKLRSYPAFAGATSFARCAENDTLRRQTIRLLTAIGYRGIFDLDYRLDRRDGEYKLLDFNPRVGAQFRLFEDDHGIDVVRALHLDLTGLTIPPGAQIEGRTFLSEIHDAAAARRYIRAGRLTVKGWLRSVSAIDEGGWFARDDPVPFLMLALRCLAEASSRFLPVSLAAHLDEKPPRAVGSASRRVDVKGGGSR